MTISLITATYNSAATLGDTLASVARQQTQPHEVLIQDGGSTDGTLEIARSYPFCKVVSEADGGLYNAMNRGVARATGEIVGILNSDDFYASHRVLDYVTEAFAADPDLDAVYGNLKYVAFDDTTKELRYWKARPYHLSKWKRGWMPPHPTFFVRKSVYERFGGFREELRFAADYEFMLRCCFKEGIKVGYIPRVLVHMRAGGVSNSSVENRLRANQEDRLAWELNGLKPPLLLPVIKPLRKIKQWVRSMVGIG